MSALAALLRLELHPHLRVLQRSHSIYQWLICYPNFEMSHISNFIRNRLFGNGCRNHACLKSPSAVFRQAFIHPLRSRFLHRLAQRIQAPAFFHRNIHRYRRSLRIAQNARLPRVRRQ